MPPLVFLGLEVHLLGLVALEIPSAGDAVVLPAAWLGLISLHLLEVLGHLEVLKDEVVVSEVVLGLRLAVQGFVLGGVLASLHSTHPVEVLLCVVITYT